MYTRLIIATFLLSLLSHKASSQDKTVTLIFIRHAEKAKDGSNDPSLTKEGKERAIALEKILKDVEVSAIYSTDYKRTMETVQPLATSKGVRIQIYNEVEKTLDDILPANKGNTIVISGHSNTIPRFLNLLANTNTFKVLGENEYDKLFIVFKHMLEPATVTTLNYGNPSK